MTYEFTTDKVGKVTLSHFGEYNKSFTIHGVDAQQSDANIIIGGVNQLLSIANFQNKYDPEDVVRTVNQNVVANQ
ncbi:MAG: hypothetical protein SR3Q1_00270 [Quinella sp. 3Q1]|nr:hypothetical protein [Quinella sp. 3Q1]MBR6889050.1 hypothetical protein [Selenomonadaceae bacterium]